MSKDAWIAAYEKAEETLSQDLDNFMLEMLDLGFDGADTEKRVHAVFTELLKAWRS